MDTLGINNIGVNQYKYVDAIKNKKSAAQVNSFKEKLQGSINDISQKPICAKSQNGMIVSQPPIYGLYGNDDNTLNKPKADMTMDEYKQYFANKMSKIPVSSYYRASFTGSLVITEKAFEKMKSDPKWEKTVLNMLKEMYSVRGLPQRSYCMQVIGASPKECYGYSVPVDNASGSWGTSKRKKSWWQQLYENNIGKY